MAYTKTNWKDRNVEHPNRYTLVDNGDGTVTLAPVPGTVTEEGTPLSATNMNKLESQYDEAKANLDAHEAAADPHLQYKKDTDPPNAHAASHASDGSDPVTPESIGAETPAGAQEKADTVQTNLDSHLADYVLQIPYAAATGTANTYAVTLNPALTSYVEGTALAVKINISNTGAATININGLGTKSIVDSKGNAMTSGKLLAGSIYTIRYSGTNFIVQGEGASGNATASDLLSGKTATVDAGEITGTMPNKGAYNITPGRVNKTIPAGYHNGSGLVYGDTDLIADNIRSGKDIFGVAGSLTDGIDFHNATYGFVGGGTFSTGHRTVLDISGSGYLLSFMIDKDTGADIMIRIDGDSFFRIDGYDEYHLGALSIIRFTTRLEVYSYQLSSNSGEFTAYSLD